MTAVGVLGGAGVVTPKAGVALEVAELGRELLGFHTVAACGEVTSTGL